MLEYFTAKKIKKHRAEKEAQKAASESAPSSAVPSENVAKEQKDSSDPQKAKDAELVLKPEDEKFLQDILANDAPAPALPPRPHDSEFDWPSDSDIGSSHSDVPTPITTTNKSSESVTGSDSAKDGDKPKAKEPQSNRLSRLFSSRKPKYDKLAKAGLHPNDNVTPKEADKEKHDMGKLLDRLNLSAHNNKVFALSADSSLLLSRFTQVFKDLANGVPTAYDDLSKLIEDRDGTISKAFEILPSPFKKLVTQLPEKMTKSLAPELLLAAAESQGLKQGAEYGAKESAKKLFSPANLSKLVTTPGAVVGMLRAIVEALKARWPAFIGMNVIWSIALSLLLFMLWYCHKRGRQVRLEHEASGQSTIEGDKPATESEAVPLSEEGTAPVAAVSERTPTIEVTTPPTTQ